MNPASSGFREPTAGERFLQQALGTQGDVRVPAVALSLALMLAVVAVAVKKLRARRLQRFESGEEAE